MAAINPETIEVSTSTEGLNTAEKLALAEAIFERGLDILREVLRESPNPNKEAYVYNHLKSTLHGGYNGHTPTLRDWVIEEGGGDEEGDFDY